MGLIASSALILAMNIRLICRPASGGERKLLVTANDFSSLVEIAASKLEVADSSQVIIQIKDDEDDELWEIEGGYWTNVKAGQTLYATSKPGEPSAAAAKASTSKAAGKKKATNDKEKATIGAKRKTVSRATDESGTSATEDGRPKSRRRSTVNQSDMGTPPLPEPAEYPSPSPRFANGASSSARQTVSNSPMASTSSSSRPRKSRPTPAATSNDATDADQQSDLAWQAIEQPLTSVKRTETSSRKTWLPKDDKLLWDHLRRELSTNPPDCSTTQGREQPFVNLLQNSNVFRGRTLLALRSRAYTRINNCLINSVPVPADLKPLFPRMFKFERLTQGPAASGPSTSTSRPRRRPSSTATASSSTPGRKRSSARPTSITVEDSSDESGQDSNYEGVSVELHSSDEDQWIGPSVSPGGSSMSGRRSYSRQGVSDGEDTSASESGRSRIPPPLSPRLNRERRQQEQRQQSSRAPSSLPPQSAVAPTTLRGPGASRRGSARPPVASSSRQPSGSNAVPLQRRSPAFAAEENARRIQQQQAANNPFAARMPPQLVAVVRSSHGTTASPSAPASASAVPTTAVVDSSSLPPIAGPSRISAPSRVPNLTANTGAGPSTPSATTGRRSVLDPSASSPPSGRQHLTLPIKDEPAEDSTQTIGQAHIITKKEDTEVDELADDQAEPLPVRRNGSPPQAALQTVRPSAIALDSCAMPADVDLLQSALSEDWRDVRERVHRIIRTSRPSSKTTLTLEDINFKAAGLRLSDLLKDEYIKLRSVWQPFTDIHHPLELNNRSFIESAQSLIWAFTFAIASIVFNEVAPPDWSVRRACFAVSMYLGSLVTNISDKKRVSFINDAADLLWSLRCAAIGSGHLERESEDLCAAFALFSRGQNCFRRLFTRQLSSGSSRNNVIGVAQGSSKQEYDRAAKKTTSLLVALVSFLDKVEASIKFMQRSPLPASTWGAEPVFTKDMMPDHAALDRVAERFESDRDVVRGVQRVKAKMEELVNKELLEVW